MSMDVDQPTAAVADATAQDLSGDGGVLKTILHEGSGWEKPNKGIEVAGTYQFLHILPRIIYSLHAVDA